MVQGYKNTDLDLFQKIDLTNPKDELLKKKQDRFIATRKK